MIINGRRFKYRILINAHQNARCFMMDVHNFIYIAYNIRIILISVIRYYLSLDPEVRVSKKEFISKSLNALA